MSSQGEPLFWWMMVAILAVVGVIGAGLVWLFVVASDLGRGAQDRTLSFQLTRHYTARIPMPDEADPATTCLLIVEEQDATDPCDRITVEISHPRLDCTASASMHFGRGQGPGTAFSAMVATIPTEALTDDPLARSLSVLPSMEGGRDLDDWAIVESATATQCVEFTLDEIVGVSG